MEKNKMFPPHAYVGKGKDTDYILLDGPILSKAIKEGKVKIKDNKQHIITNIEDVKTK